MAETPDVNATVQQIEALLEELGGADPQLRQGADPAESRDESSRSMQSSLSIL